jgi:hypothetical protein
MGAGYKGYLHTKGANERFKPQNLMNELKNSGVKYSERDVVLVTKNYAGKLLWLEKGNKGSGLTHIMHRHGNNFKNLNVLALIKTLVKQKPIAHFEKNNGKQLSDIYIYQSNGKTYLLAYGDNGYIVTFYRVSGGRYVQS